MYKSSTKTEQNIKEKIQTNTDKKVYTKYNHNHTLKGIVLHLSLNNSS